MKFVLFILFLLTSGGLFAGTTDLNKPGQILTEEDLENLLRQENKIAVYGISVAMPWSLQALPEMKVAAKKLNYKLVVVNDPLAPVMDSRGNLLAPLMDTSSQLLRGFHLHFPSLLVFKNQKQCGPIIAGYKSRKTYQTILKRHDLNCEKFRPQIESKFAFTQLPNSEVVYPLPLDAIYFFKPMGDDWVSFRVTDKKSDWSHDIDYNTYFYNLKTGQVLNPLFNFGPDPTPTPDFRFLTVAQYFRMYKVEEVFKGNTKAIYADSALGAAYQSIGMLDAAAFKYRTIVGDGELARFRDIQWNGTKIIQLTSAGDLCPRIKGSMPILSKNGKMLAYRDNNTGDTLILSVVSAGRSCKLLKKIPLKTGKVSFSYDNSKVVYIADVNGAGVIYLTDLKTGNNYELVPPQANHSRYFPEFIPNGNIIYHEIIGTPTGRQNNLVELQF